MDQTLFYALGITLVVAALVVSAVGLKFESFPPSRTVMLAVIGVFIVLVGGTTTFAVLNARDEQHKKEAEAAASSTESTAATTAGSTTTATTSTSSSTPSGGQSASSAGSVAEGKQLFDSQGCAGCHTLAAAGSTGTTGPDLDKYLKGKPASFVMQSIVDPNAFIAQGYSPDIMPQTFGSSLSSAQIDSLVQFVEQSVNGK